MAIAHDNTRFSTALNRSSNIIFLPIIKLIIRPASETATSAPATLKCVKSVYFLSCCRFLTMTTSYLTAFKEHLLAEPGMELTKAALKSVNVGGMVRPLQNYELQSVVSVLMVEIRHDKKRG